MQPYYDHAGITIFNADCRDVLPTLGPVELVLTDPPYGVNHDTDYTRFTGPEHDRHLWMSRTHTPLANDRESFDPAHLLSIGSQHIIFGMNHFSQHLPPGSLLVWDKRDPAGGASLMSDAEAAWWDHGRGIYIFSHMWIGYRRKSEIGQHTHPTQKPVSLMRWCIQRSKATGTILDPYMGSGPVLQAAKELGSRAIGIEIDERYCEIAARRLSQEVFDFST
jgi:DNA modification methylase